MRDLPACRRLLFPLLHVEKGRLLNAVANRVPASRPFSACNKGNRRRLHAGKWETRSSYFSPINDRYSKYGLRARDCCSTLHKFQPKLKVVKYTQSTFVYFLEYFGLYFLTRVFLAYFSRVICVQYRGFTRKKRECNVAIPAECTVRLNFNYFGDMSALQTVL